MGTGREFEGRDLGEALRVAAKALGTRPGEVDYELLTEGRRGVFGIGARNVRIWVDLPDGRLLAQPSDVTTQARPLPTAGEGAWAEKMLRQIVETMGLDLEVRLGPLTEGGIRLEMSGGDTTRLIERDGELLGSLQFVLNRMARHRLPDACRIHIECQGYRDRRDRELIDKTREAAREVSRTGVAQWLGPLNPYERRVVHVTVREFPGLSSRSEGSAFLKQVRLSLSEPKGEA